MSTAPAGAVSVTDLFHSLKVMLPPPAPLFASCSGNDVPVVATDIVPFAELISIAAAAPTLVSLPFWNGLAAPWKTWVKSCFMSVSGVKDFRSPVVADAFNHLFAKSCAAAALPNCRQNAGPALK